MVKQLSLNWTKKSIFFNKKVHSSFYYFVTKHFMFEEKKTFVLKCQSIFFSLFHYISNVYLHITSQWPDFHVLFVISYLFFPWEAGTGMFFHNLQLGLETMRTHSTQFDCMKALQISFHLIQFFQRPREPTFWIMSHTENNSLDSAE